MQINFVPYPAKSGRDLKGFILPNIGEGAKERLVQNAEDRVLVISASLRKAGNFCPFSLIEGAHMLIVVMDRMRRDDEFP